jgi:hypothetical protein
LFEKDDFRATFGSMIEKIVMLRGFTTSKSITCAAHFDGRLAHPRRSCCRSPRFHGCSGLQAEVSASHRKQRERNQNADDDKPEHRSARNEVPIIHLPVLKLSGLILRS